MPNVWEELFGIAELGMADMEDYARIYPSEYQPEDLEALRAKIERVHRLIDQQREGRRWSGTPRKSNPSVNGG